MLLTAPREERRPLHTTSMGSLSGRPQDDLSQSLTLVSSSFADKKAQPGWLAALPSPCPQSRRSLPAPQKMPPSSRK